MDLTVQQVQQHDKETTRRGSAAIAFLLIACVSSSGILAKRLRLRLRLRVCQGLRLRLRLRPLVR